MNAVRVLATDLDGTLIPLAGSRENVRDLRLLEDELESRAIRLVYVTGRDFARVSHAIDEFGLPKPHGVICDVGATLITFENDQGGKSCARYEAHLGSVTRDFPVEPLLVELGRVNELRMQEADRQGRFKFSFYCEADASHDVGLRVTRLLQELAAPYEAVVSVDPFEGRGLIDVLPRGVNKASALDWWVVEQGFDSSGVVFAGDSGNDLAVFTAGYRSVIVGNAHDHVVAAARGAHSLAGWEGRLYVAQQAATSGVLEGVRYYVQRQNERG